MILQYRGYNNNWCCRESKEITYAHLQLKDLIGNINIIGGSSMSAEDNLKNTQHIHKCVDEYIYKQTGCSGNIIYLIGDLKFSHMNNIIVVMLDDKNYAFVRGDKRVYMLNSAGQTVQKLN